MESPGPLPTVPGNSSDAARRQQTAEILQFVLEKNGTTPQEIGTLLECLDDTTLGELQYPRPTEGTLGEAMATQSGKRVDQLLAWCFERAFDAISNHELSTRITKQADNALAAGMEQIGRLRLAGLVCAPRGRERGGRRPAPVAGGRPPAARPRQRRQDTGTDHGSGAKSEQ